jgi:hypothetical protein
VGCAFSRTIRGSQSEKGNASRKGKKAFLEGIVAGVYRTQLVLFLWNEKTMSGSPLNAG